MPKEAKKRGRRAEKKRKEEREADELKQNANFVPIEQQEEAEAEAEAEYYDDGAQQHAEDTPFHGLLTTEESEYFRNVDEVLEANAFSDPDERSLFIANVYREASGKELKLASSQGCSRLLEKLVQLSTPAQLKRLWRAFSGHFVGLVQHRFASHCCEVLFERSVVVAGREMQKEYREEEEVVEEEGGEPWASMESLFLYMLNEIEPEIIPLLTHTFASHPIRALLLILSGQPAAASPSSQSLVQSRKKRNISVVTADFAPPEAIEVPESFTEAAERIVAAVGACLGVEQIRAMAVHPIGGPTLQVLLQVEMRRSRGKGEATLLGKLAGISAGDDEEKEGEEGEERSSFFSNLLYDPVGSHLAEKIMSYAPKREFKKLYRAHFRTRMGSLARNETAGFVVVRVLEKVGREVLKEAVGEILKEVPGMIERGQVAVIKTLIDVCGKQEVDVADISKAIFTAYDCPSSQLIFKMLSLTPEELVPPPIEEGKEPPKPKRDPKQRHGSLLAQCLLHHQGDLHDTLSGSLVSQSPDTTVGLCQHAQASHVVQAFLLSPHTTAPEKRKLLNGLRGSWAALTVHPSGSHIADAAWTATAGGGLTNYRQAIAAELLSSEPVIRESFFGRAVWRNWAMDKYKTRRNEWFGLAKGEASGASSLASGVGGLRIGGGGGTGNGAPAVVAAQGPGPRQRQQGERKKTAIELARERHAAAKKRAAATTTSGQPKSSSGSGSGSNALAPPLPPPTKRQRVV